MRVWAFSGLGFKDFGCIVVLSGVCRASLGVHRLFVRFCRILCRVHKSYYSCLQGFVGFRVSGRVVWAGGSLGLHGVTGLGFRLGIRALYFSGSEMRVYPKP